MSGAVGRDDRAADGCGEVSGEEGDDVRDCLRLDGMGHLFGGKDGPVDGCAPRRAAGAVPSGRGTGAWRASSAWGSINSDSESDPSVRSVQSNYVYLRVWNRGTDATAVTGTAYWSPPATLVTPALWNLIGSDGRKRGRPGPRPRHVCQPERPDTAEDFRVAEGLASYTTPMSPQRGNSPHCYDGGSCW